MAKAGNKKVLRPFHFGKKIKMVEFLKPISA
jgi:hypothetical protein